MIRQEMNRIDPDVMGLTEVGVAITPQGHVIEADPDYGYTHDGSRRKVILWSKTPWEEMDAIGDPEMPTGRFVSGVTQGIRFVGVCIPWRDAHVKTGRKDRSPWEDHLAYCRGLQKVLHRYADDSRPVCVLGDFNQRIPRVSQPERVFDALIQSMPPSFRILTQGLQDSEGKSVIDHLVISDNLAAGTVTVIPRFASDGTRLSDHVGIHATFS